MNARVVVLAALVASAPAVVHAQSEEQPGWTLGAGIAPFGSVFLLGPPTSYGVYPQGAVVPLATAFVERRIGERSWLVLSGSGTASRIRSESEADTVRSTEVESEVFQASLSVGLRRVVTRPGSIVDVSLVATVGGGYAGVEDESGTAGLPAVIESDGAFAVADAGIAVERALTDALALRIATPLVQLWWSRYEREERTLSGNVSREYESGSASVTLAPRLELRLAF